MKRTYVCYGNERSSVLEAASTLFNPHQDITYSSGGVKGWVREGQPLDEPLIDCALKVEPALETLLTERRRRSFTKQELEDSALVLGVDNYLLREVLPKMGINVTDKYQPVLRFAGLKAERLGEDLDCASNPIERKVAKYIQKVDMPAGQAHYFSLEGAQFFERTAEAYKAMVKDLIRIAKSVSKNG
ncbi:MAG: hypothetical protein JSW08_01425 [archaeon]|nr:MAG: hypothetical protein JSW08_01425 [archaeon]